MKVISASSDDQIKVIDFKTMKTAQTIHILDQSLNTRLTMAPNCKFLGIGGENSNLYVYNMDTNDFDQCPDVSDLTTGISDMDWD